MFSGAKRLVRVHGIPPPLLVCLHTHHIHTVEDVLTRNTLELMTLLDLSLPQVSHLTQLVSTAVTPTPLNVLSMYSHSDRGTRYLSTSLEPLDTLLHGGLPAGCVTEVTAPPGCGKTQLCITMCASTVTQHCHQEQEQEQHRRQQYRNEEEEERRDSVIYIDTEGAFSAARLVEVMCARHPALYSTMSTLASRVHVFRDLTCDAIAQRLESLDELVASHNAGLVVVDSMASLLRKEYDTRSRVGLADRSTMLSRLASLLKYTAAEFMIPVLVTNQVTTHLSSKQCRWSSDGDRVVTASLGNTWAHCVTVRLVMEYSGGVKRKILVTKSPMCASGSVLVTIGEQGLTAEGKAVTTESIGDPTITPLATKPHPQAV